MASIEDSLKKIALNNSKILEEIEKRLSAATLKTASSAARLSSSALAGLAHDPTLNSMIKKMGSWGGFAGKKAGKEFSKQFKQNIGDMRSSFSKIQGMIADVERRTKRLSERKTAGWSKAAGVQRDIMEARKQMTEQMALNQKLMNTLAYQAGKTQDPHEKAVLQAKRKQLKEVNAQLQETLDLSEMLGVQTRQLEIEEFVQRQKERAFGWIDKVNGKVEGAKDGLMHMVKNPKVGLTLLASAAGIALMAMANQAIEAGKEFRNAGQFASQMAKSVALSSDISRDMLKRGLIVPAKESAEAISSIQTELGELSVPRELAGEAAYMVKMFRLSNTEAAQLVTTLFRFNRRNVKETQDTLKYVGAFAKVNGLNTQQIMRDMSQHAEDFAKSGNMSAQAFARAAADARRIGYSMSSMTQLADRLVSDFEGALQTQAELSTMFPGMDMTETMYASQFGTNEDIAESVKRMINNSGYDINALPRSFKMALQRNTGLSATELANIAGSSDMSKFATPDQKDQIGIIEAGMTQAFDALSEPKEIIRLLTGILHAVNPIAAIRDWGDEFKKRNQEAAEKARSHNNLGVRVTKGTGKLSREDVQFSGRYFHDGGIVGTSGRPAKLPKFHSGLLSDEMLAVLQKGEAVLTEEMQRGVSALADRALRPDPIRVEVITPKETEPSVITKAPMVERVAPTVQPKVSDVAPVEREDRVTKQTTQPSVVIDTTKLENLLTQLIGAVKEGKVIEMDAKKVGQLITAANSRIG